MALFSTRMPSSGRSLSWSAWVYAENKPLQVLGVPLVPPRCGVWARRHHAEMAFMDELWFAVVPPPPAPTSFFMLLPKAPTNFSIAEALFDLSGRSAEGASVSLVGYGRLHTSYRKPPGFKWWHIYWALFLGPQAIAKWEWGRCGFPQLATY